MKKLRTVLVILCVVSACICAGTAAYHLYSNLKLRNGFQQADHAYPYEEALEKGEINPDIIGKRYSGISTMVGFGDKKDIECPVTIRYYADMNGKQPAYVIEKGTKIHIDADKILNSEMVFRGVGSLPTEKAGWRLSFPFAEWGKPENDTLLYVNLSDLQQAVLAWMKENPKTVKWMQTGTAQQKLLPTEANIINYLLLSNDRTLYEKGVYLSKDLMDPVISPAVIISFCIFVVLLAGVLWVSRKLRRASGKTE